MVIDIFRLPISLERTLYGGNWGSTGPGHEPTDWRYEEAFDRHVRGTHLQPHVISHSLHGLYPDEDANLKITRSEILLAADLMRERLKCPLYVTNDLYPVWHALVHYRLLTYSSRLTSYTIDSDGFLLQPTSSYE